MCESRRKEGGGGGGNGAAGGRHSEGGISGALSGYCVFALSRRGLMSVHPQEILFFLKDEDAEIQSDVVAKKCYNYNESR